MNTALAVTLMVALQADGGTPAAPLTKDAAIARVDELWRKRDDAAAFAEQKKLLDEALARAPGDYGLLWRAARWYFWQSDSPDLSNQERSQVGKIGWDIAERAVAANPNHVAGHYWAMATMGNYSLGLGVVRALAAGMEGKFRARIGRAGQLDAKYEFGGIDNAWGRFYAKLPWPKYDAKKAAQHFSNAVQTNPHNLRARVFWADLMLEEDNPKEAKRILDEVAAAPAGKYDLPEEKRAKLMGGRLMRKVLDALK